jgi:hypothetical protein
MTNLFTDPRGLRTLPRRRRGRSLVETLTISALNLAFDLVLAWLGMIVLGAAHSGDARVPDFGFWTTFLVICVVLVLPIRSFKISESLRSSR